MNNNIDLNKVNLKDLEFSDEKASILYFEEGTASVEKLKELAKEQKAKDEEKKVLKLSNEIINTSADNSFDEIIETFEFFGDDD